MEKYRVFLKSKWISFQRPTKLKYDVFALNEAKAILEAIQLKEKEYGEIDYYEDYCIENVICLSK